MAYKSFFVLDIHHFLASRSVSSRLTSEGLFVNGGFKLLAILTFIIADDLYGELLLWTTTVISTKALILVKKLQKQ